MLQPPKAPVKEVLCELPMDDYNKLTTDIEKKQFLGNYLYVVVVKFI
jgi:hypothetical protein